MNLKFININININKNQIILLLTIILFSIFSMFSIFLVDVAFAETLSETLAQEEPPKIFLEIQHNFYMNSSIPLEEQYNGIDLYRHFLLILLSGHQKTQSALAIFTPELCRDYFAQLSNPNVFIQKHPYFDSVLFRFPIIVENLNLFFSNKDYLDFILALESDNYKELLDIQIAKFMGHHEGLKVISDTEGLKGISDAAIEKIIIAHINKRIAYREAQWKRPNRQPK
jgi:hypothetical protein